MSENWVAIGRLWRVRGNRGELAGELDSDRPGREDLLKEVALERDGRREVLRVAEVWRHLGVPIFRFEGIDSISEAERWAGAEILVPESQRIEPAEGEYSHADLAGSMLMDLRSGTEIGRVEGVVDLGGPPLLRIKAVTDGREILVPFARSICKEIDVRSKIIRAELPDGLLDLP